MNPEEIDDEDDNEEMDSSEVDDVMEIVADLFPDMVQEIYEIGAVTWMSLLNHSQLKGLDEKHILFAASVVVTMALTHFKVKSMEMVGLVDSIKECSLSDAIQFMDDENKKENKVKKKKE